MQQHSLNMKFNRFVDQFHRFAIAPSGGNATDAGRLAGLPLDFSLGAHSGYSATWNSFVRAAAIRYPRANLVRISCNAPKAIINMAGLKLQPAAVPNRAAEMLGRDLAWINVVEGNDLSNALGFEQGKLIKRA